jgi:hypothetical protein
MWQSILSNEIEFVAWFWSLIKYNDKIMYEIDIRWNTLGWNKNDTSWKRYKGFLVNFRLLSLSFEVMALWKRFLLLYSMD